MHGRPLGHSLLHSLPQELQLVIMAFFASLGGSYDDVLIMRKILPSPATAFE